MRERAKGVRLWGAGILVLTLAGCAATTEPAVRAYLHEQQAYSECFIAE